MPIPFDPRRLYHGVFPGIDTGEEDRVTWETLKAYQDAAGRDAAWVYFSHEWSNGEVFPIDMARWIHARGRIPLVRLMMRHDTEQPSGGSPDPDQSYSLESINNGVHDEKLYAWGRAAANDFGAPLAVEYGTEVNGFWFRWNGLHNGGAAGPDNFVNAYRRIVRIVRDDAGARNVTWVFHVNDRDYPEPNTPQTSWNTAEHYYPGDDFVDWLGVSVYGAQVPKADQTCELFAPRFAAVYDRLAAKATGKPIFLLEFGATKGHPNARRNEQCRPDKWADAAFEAVFNKTRYPMLCGFSWWNEGWPNTDAPRTEMRVQKIPELADIFRRRLTGNPLIIDRPLT